MQYASQTSVQAASVIAPVIVAGSSVAARARGVTQVKAAGLRLADAVTIGDAVDRIAQQAKASAVWVELDRDEGPALDRLLERVERDVQQKEYAGIVAVTPELIDLVSARLSSGRVDLLVNDGSSADNVERVTALMVGVTPPSVDAKALDAATDTTEARYRQLSEEVGRIAATLTRLSGGPSAIASGMIGVKAEAAAAGKPVAELTSATLRTVIRARRMREKYFSGELFADPAWDMLLDLTQAELTHVRVPVSSLCIAAAVPATTALRWIKTLTDAGLLLRRADPHDGRRVFIEMAATTSEAMRRYFAEVAAPAGV